MDMKDCAAALSEWRKLAVDKHVNLFTEVARKGMREGGREKEKGRGEVVTHLFMKFGNCHNL